MLPAQLAAQGLSAPMAPEAPPRATMASVSFAYPAIFLLPVALVAVIAVLAWALSRDVER